MEELKIGSRGQSVRLVQEFLKIDVDGIYGPKTEKAVKDWQRLNKLNPTGVVDLITWRAMKISTTDLNENQSAVNISTNIIVPPVSKETKDIEILEYLLPPNEYFKGPTNKKWVFLHHTAGNEDPFKTILYWKEDTRGPIATEFVIGGASIKGDNTKHDGKIVRSFPEGGYAYHLGVGNTEMHRNSVGIEICSYGQLTKGGYYKYENGALKWIKLKENSFYTYTGLEANIMQVHETKQTFRGFKFWHKYSDEQIKSLSKLLKYIANRDNIDLKKGLPELIKSKGVFQAFDFYDVKYVEKNPGLWIHANVLKTKTDVFPQQELVDMIMSL